MRLAFLTAGVPHPTNIDLCSRETSVFGLPVLHRAVILAKRYFTATKMRFVGEQLDRYPESDRSENMPLFARSTQR